MEHQYPGARLEGDPHEARFAEAIDLATGSQGVARPWRRRQRHTARGTVPDTNLQRRRAATGHGRPRKGRKEQALRRGPGEVDGNDTTRQRKLVRQAPGSLRSALEGRAHLAKIPGYNLRRRGDSGGLHDD